MKIENTLIYLKNQEDLSTLFSYLDRSKYELHQFIKPDNTPTIYAIIVDINTKCPTLAEAINFPSASSIDLIKYLLEQPVPINNITNTKIESLALSGASKIKEARDIVISSIKSVQDYMEFLHSEGKIDINEVGLNYESVKTVHSRVHNTWSVVKGDAKLIEIRQRFLTQLEEAVMLIYGEEA